MMGREILEKECFLGCSEKLTPSFVPFGQSSSSPSLLSLTSSLFASIFSPAKWAEGEFLISISLGFSQS